VPTVRQLLFAKDGERPQQAKSDGRMKRDTSQTVSARSRKRT
jgi:hypothetical protein